MDIVAALAAPRATQLTQAGLRVLLIWLCVNAAVLLWAHAIGLALIPLYRAALGWWFTDYHVESLHIGQVAGEAVFQLVVTTRNAYRVAGQMAPAGMEISSSTLLGHAFQPLIVLACLLALWPSPSWRLRTALAVIATVFVLVFMLFDVPLVLLGALDELMQASVHCATSTSNFSVWWMNAMNGGGRLALPIVALSLSVCLLRLVPQSIVKK